MPNNLTLLTKAGFRIVFVNHSVFKLLLKTFRETIFFCESWSPANFGNNQMAHSGRLQRKMHKNFTLLTKTGFRIVVANHSFLKLPMNLAKNAFFCESWSPANFGNNQMAHSGRWQQIISKNLTLFTKTGFRIVVANHSFFQLPVNLSKIFFCVNPGVPQFFGTIRWHILDDCDERCPKI